LASRSQNLSEKVDVLGLVPREPLQRGVDELGDGTGAVVTPGIDGCRERNLVEETECPFAGKTIDERNDAAVRLNDQRGD